MHVSSNRPTEQCAQGGERDFPQLTCYGKAPSVELYCVIHKVSCNFHGSGVGPDYTAGRGKEREHTSFTGPGMPFKICVEMCVRKGNHQYHTVTSMIV